MDEIVEEFLLESAEGLARIERDLVTLEGDAGRADVLDRIFRDVHTIKGVAGFLGYHHLEKVTHVGESLLGKVRGGEVAVSEAVVSALLGAVDAIRAMLDAVAQTGGDGDDPREALVARLEALLGAAPPPPPPDSPIGEVLVARGVATREQVEDALAQQERGDPRKLGEILVRRHHVSAAALDAALDAQRAVRAGAASIEDATLRVSVDLLDELMDLVGELAVLRNQICERSQHTDDADASRHAQRLSVVTAGLQEGVTKARMQPIGTIWAKLPRIVRDLAHACDKEMRLEMEGSETVLDRTILEAIKDPLTHLVRNACDHGMETPDERAALGKPREGVMRLRAYRAGAEVLIEVSDDGRGLDAEKIRREAVERGILDVAAAARLPDREALSLILLPGFSTAEQITTVSGRGVGMDVVRTNVERIGGAVELSSVLGRGTTIGVRIPLTLVPAPIVDGSAPSVLGVERQRVGDGVELLDVHTVLAVAAPETSGADAPR